jgi:hypothetical protein
MKVLKSFLLRTVCVNQMTHRDLWHLTFPRVELDLNWDCGAWTSDARFTEAHLISINRYITRKIYFAVSHSTLPTKHTETSIRLSTMVKVKKQVMNNFTVYYDHVICVCSHYPHGLFKDTRDQWTAIRKHSWWNRHHSELNPHVYNSYTTKISTAVAYNVLYCVSSSTVMG